MLQNKNFKFLTSALLLGGSASAQYTPTQIFQGKIGKTIEESKEWLPTQKTAPEGAPNVIYIVLDDIGFGGSSAFGGLIQTPNIDRLANNGLRYTNYHTTSISTPTRAALITGRNSHSVHLGYFAHSSYNTPGYDGYLPFEKGTVAEILRENGYNTFAVGKYHLTHPSEASAAGPFNRWPTGRGFDHYYGFAPESWGTDQWHPTLYRDTHREADDPQGRHTTELLANNAIQYISEQKSAAPEKPFFLYFATGAGHAPHQVPKEWIEKYKGKFDFGWDKYREIVLQNQIKAGLVPANTVLPPSNEGVKAWDSLNEDEKKLFSRYFELYAGFISHADYEIGRIIKFLEQSKQLDNTLIFVSIGDNGASPEGRAVGSAFPRDREISDKDAVSQTLKNIEQLGTDKSNVNYPHGWAQAGNTPFRYWKFAANSEGGTRNPLIVFWPKVIKDKGGIRNQYLFTNDVVPTTLELVGAKIPAVINGYPQDPLEGTSFAFTLAPENKALPTRHTTQYFEINGARAIYKDGWKAEAAHQRGTDPTKDKWLLYNLNEDFNERFDIADKNPEKLKELQDLFDAEAWKYNVYPIKDSWKQQNVNIYNDKKQIVLYPGVSLTTYSAPKTDSFDITADLIIPANGAEGVLLSSGSQLGGFSFYVKDKKLNFTYNAEGIITDVISKQTVPTGAVELKAEIEYDATAKTRTVTLYFNDKKVSESIQFKAGSTRTTLEGWEVGRDISTPVSPKYKVPFAFTGTLNKIIVDIK
jgi:arylsulfatase A-like enzyme